MWLLGDNPFICFYQMQLSKKGFMARNFTFLMMLISWTIRISINEAQQSVLIHYIQEGVTNSFH